MQAMTMTSTAARIPIWFWAAATFGVLWNLYGMYQYAGSFTQTRDSLMAAGMTTAQVDIYLGLPVRISVAFGLGVVFGLVGSIALLLRHSVAVPIFAASLAGYLFLFAGDAYYGVFAGIPSQLAILAAVVVIAAALHRTAWVARKRGLLR